MENKDFISNFYTWILVLGVLGGLLILGTEFAGYIAGPYSYWYSVSLGSAFVNIDHLPYAPIFLVLAGLFFLNALIGLQELKLTNIQLPFITKQIGFFSAIGILAISVIGGLAFEIIMAESGAINWWLGTGFYAGIIGGGLLTFFHYSLRDTPKGEA